MTNILHLTLHRKPARIRIIQHSESCQPEPLALEDFAQENFFEDQPESIPANQVITASVPAEEPYYTIEQVQQEVQSAYERGFNDGQQVASAVLETEINTLTERVRNLDSAFLSLQRQYAEAISHIDHVALNLAVKIAHAILGYEARTSVQCVLEQARAALEQYHGKDVVTIRLHPTSLEMLQRAGSTLLDSNNGTRSITLIADPSVEAGGCILETALGSFDAQLSSQLERAHTLLADELTQATTTPDEQSNAV